MLGSLLAWLLFPLGAAFGWYLARRTPRNLSGKLGSDAMSGIGYLVNDDPDQAIAALLRAVELDADAVELHLTLGSLFRKRGQVDRALRLHEALVARPGLAAGPLHRARFELATDHLHAGLYDRAEQLFSEMAAQGIKVIASLEAVVSIHERSHEWDKALEAGKRLEAATGKSRQAITAHYHCEIAEQRRVQTDLAGAQKAVRKALDADPRCARASLLQGRLCEEQDDWSAAIQAYRRVAEQDPGLISEVLNPLWRCTRESGTAEAFVRWLDELQGEAPSGAAVVMRAELMQQTGFDARSFLVEQFTARPSWPILERMATLESTASESSSASTLVATVRDSIVSLARARPRYQCSNCGMQPGLLFWQCPSCHLWGTIAPHADQIGSPAQSLS